MLWPAARQRSTARLAAAGLAAVAVAAGSEYSRGRRDSTVRPALKQ